MVRLIDFFHISYARKLVLHKGDIYISTNVQLFLRPRVCTMCIDRYHFLDLFCAATQFSSCACHPGSYCCPYWSYHPKYAQQLYAKGNLRWKLFLIFSFIEVEFNQCLSSVPASLTDWRAGILSDWFNSWLSGWAPNSLTDWPCWLTH